jgi:hypothetical protein
VCPHYYCLPVLKREEHRLALVKAATSGATLVSSALRLLRFLVGCCLDAC